MVLCREIWRFLILLNFLSYMILPLSNARPGVFLEGGGLVAEEFNACVTVLPSSPAKDSVEF